MSRIGKLPIEIPAGVEVTVSENNVVKVKGPLGVLTQVVNPVITVKVEGSILELQRHTEQKDHKAMHGLYRALLANMVTGVSQGFRQALELVGVGYRAASQGQIIDFALGYSHNIMFEVPAEVKVETVSEKGKNPTVILTSADKQLLGQVAAKISSLRKPEPYKGKGVKFEGRVYRRKEGKSAGKK